MAFSRRDEVSTGGPGGLGRQLGKGQGVTAVLVPLQDGELPQRRDGVDTHAGVPACGGEDFAVGADPQALLAGVLRRRDVERRGLDLDAGAGVFAFAFVAARVVDSLVLGEEGAAAGRGLGGSSCGWWDWEWLSGMWNGGDRVFCNDGVSG